MAGCTLARLLSTDFLLKFSFSYCLLFLIKIGISRNRPII